MTPPPEHDRKPTGTHDPATGTPEAASTKEPFLPVAPATHRNDTGTRSTGTNHDGESHRTPPHAPNQGRDGGYLAGTPEPDRPLDAAGTSSVEALREAAYARAKMTLPRLAYRVPGELAEVLGTSADFVDRHVRPELKLVRRGAIVMVAHAEVEAWLARSGSRILDEVGL
jgi:hypothetical protein